MSEELDRLKISLEQKRLDAEIEDRRRELALREKELEVREQEVDHAKHNRFSASTTALIAGALSLLTAVITSFIGGFWSLEMQKEKNEAELLLKEQERRFQIVIKATENRTPEEAAENLLFFVDIGYLPDKDNKIREKAKAGEVPIITSPPARSGGRGQTTGPRGEQIGYLIDERGFVQFEDSWDKDNIVLVEIPQLRGVPGYHKDGRIRFHRDAASDLKAAFAEIEAEGLLHLILSWDGSYVPRTRRGSNSLSSHALGVAFDINAKWNPLGKIVPEGSEGSVVPLVQIFKKHGFKWGGEHARPEANHFEWVYP